MKINAIIGIDPGAAGGIVLWRPGQATKAIKMPKDINGLREWLEYQKSICNPIVFVEKVTVRPDDVAVDDGKANLGKLYRIQKMLQNFEQLKAAIQFLDIPFVLVNPMKWQNDLKLRIKGRKEEKSERKRRYKDVAASLYPELNATLWNADAALIMHFGRYIIKNNPDWVLSNLPSNVQDKLF